MNVSQLHIQVVWLKLSIPIPPRYPVFTGADIPVCLYCTSETWNNKNSSNIFPAKII